jgi:hypothetical protein
MTLRLPSWTVHLRGHDIERGRWSMPATTATVPAVSRQDGIENVNGQVQSAPGVPPWRPCRRQSLPFATAEPAHRPSGGMAFEPAASPRRAA